MIKNNCGFEYTVGEGTLYICLTGEMDHHSAAGLRGDVDKLIYAERPDKIMLDLSGIGFMDSSGLGFIMGRYALAHELGATLAVCNMSPATQRIFDLAGLGRIIPVESDKTEKSNHERVKK